MSHCYWSIYTCGQLNKGMQTGEFFSMSESQQQSQHDDGNAAADNFNFASIFKDDPSWLEAFAIPPGSSASQLAAVGSEVMSTGALWTLLEALDDEEEGENNPGRRATASIRPL